MRNTSYDSVENTQANSAHQKKFLSRYWERQFSWLVSSFGWKEDLHSSLAIEIVKASTYVFKSIPRQEGLFWVEKKAGQKCVFSISLL